MNSTITLYYNCLIEKDKNFILDNNGNQAIETYLQTLESVVIPDFQYVKQALSVSIKIVMEQIELNMGKNSNDLNYCKIQNGRYQTPCYYFIISKNWKSANTIELILSMDTLNTYRYDVDYKISQKTFVKRMHKPRFENIAPEDQEMYLTRKINLKSEEINVTTYKDDEITLYEKRGTSIIGWSLYYKTSDNQEETPIDCYLLPEEAIHMWKHVTSGLLNTNNVPSGKYLIFSSSYPEGALTFEAGDTITTIRQYTSAVENGYFVVAVQNDGGTIKVYSGQLGINIYDGGITRWTLIYTGASCTIMNSPEEVHAYEKATLPTAVTWYDGNEYKPETATYVLNMGSKTDVIVYGKDTINKTLDTNIKIINIPYSPTSFSIDSYGKYSVTGGWTYNQDDGTLKLTDFNSRWKNSIVSNGTDPYTNLFVKLGGLSYLNGKIRRYFKDSKLYHSDYFRPKFVYDSFNKIIALEQLDAVFDSLMDGKFKFDFVMSRNIVSKFLFKFPYVYKQAIEDYENIVAVSRNNEEVLYNSQYLNYIRNGYNYDLKSKQRQEVTSGVGIGLNVAGFLASIGIGIATQNPIAIGSAVATGIGLVSQLLNNAKTTAQNEENIQRKLQESQNQAISVLNVDDYDLLYEYTQNKAKLCTYKVSSQMEKILDDLFYYGGYVVNEQMKPDVTSRYWFNYLEATIVINETNNLTQEIQEDIQEKFSNGVTFMHYRNETFDWNQVMENIEVFLYRNDEE